MTPISIYSNVGVGEGDGGGDSANFEPPYYHHDLTSLGQSATLPDVTAANTSLDVPEPDAPRLGSHMLSKSPHK